MNTGESLIWIATVGGIIYGLYLIHKRRKWRILAKVAGAIIVFMMMASLGFYLYNFYEDRPREVGELAGIMLGMKKVDVTLAKGKPDFENTDDNGVTTLNYNNYSGTLEFAVELDSERNEVYRICSFEYYHEVLGLGVYDSYETVVKKLGESFEKSINSDGTRLLITYPQYNIAFVIHENQVEMTCVTTQDRMSFVEEYSD